MSAELPGEFAVRTYLKRTYLTARDGGGHSIDAVVTNATAVGQNEKFKLTSLQPNMTAIQTLNGHYVSAVGGGGLGAGYSDQQILQTERISPADDCFFTVAGPYGTGNSTFSTFNDHFLTALGGGGKSTGAFHTDATVADTWEYFHVLKSGYLGTGYTYGIVPAGVPLGEEAQFMKAINGGGIPSGQAVSFFSGLYSDSRFKLLELADGSYAFQTPNRINYVTAVDGGGLAHGDNLHTDATRIRAWETFRIAGSRDCTYTIQTVSGFFLAVGPDGISTRINDPDAAPEIGYNAKFEFIMVGLVKQSP